ncbi:MAG: hypothetical protein R3C69_11235 [Geminicoccaceae bacterium]
MKATAKEEERRARVVDDSVVGAGPPPARPDAVQHQAVGGDQQHLEEDEEVEDVAGEEGAVQAHELELEERMEMAAPGVVAGARIDEDEQRHDGGQEKHHG